jgi:nucleoside-diphosphate-sugar epimerase
MDYHRGDVRDPQDLQDAFGHADVVVHLAFLVTGAASGEAIRSINVEGTLNAFHSAAAAGARRSVYASSVAAYGFHSDNPIGKTEDWPVRAAARLFYAQEKAELEHLLRPSIVLGPHAVGAKGLLPGPLAPLARALASRAGQMPLPIPVLAPALPVQFVHEEDMGRALLQSVVAAGPPGAYNIAADGIVTVTDIARELGMLPLPLPAARRSSRPGSSRPCLSCRPSRDGWRRPAIRRS